MHAAVGAMSELAIKPGATPLYARAFSRSPKLPDASEADRRCGGLLAVQRTKPPSRPLYVLCFDDNFL